MARTASRSRWLKCRGVKGGQGHWAGERGGDLNPRGLECGGEPQRRLWPCFGGNVPQRALSLCPGLLWSPGSNLHCGLTQDFTRMSSCLWNEIMTRIVLEFLVPRSLEVLGASRPIRFSLILLLASQSDTRVKITWTL